MAATDLVWEGRPDLRRPVLVAGFKGWNDAANAASDAAAWLARRLDATRFASIDADRFFDFQSTRPEVVLADGVARTVVWPVNELLSAPVPGGPHDLVILRGVEPNLRWRSYCATIIAVAREVGCEMVVTLGALLADVPHTRPIRITGTATDPTLVARLGLERSRYEGPTGIVGVLHDACRATGLVSASLWAPVPHYVAAPPNPAATRELISRFAALAGVPVDVGDLDRASAAWRGRVDEIAGGDPQVVDYVRQLEERADAEAPASGDVTSGEELAAELERYLREQRGES